MEHPRIHWRNFRSFRDTGELTLKPLTIVIGSNSSGKTSLHLPLLLMKQTLDARDGSIGLVTRGHLANVGAYPDFIHGHNTDRQLELMLGFHERLAEGEQPPKRPAPADLHMSFYWDTASN